MKALFHDVLHDIWHFDHKLFESLRLLVLKPGLLTLAYLDGRRARYVPPFRLYIFLSFLLFSAFSMVPVGGKKKAPEAPPPVTVSVDTSELESKVVPDWVNGIKARGKAAKKDPERFQRAFLSNLSKSLFLLMPLFAAMLHVLYIRRSPLFVDHLILSLHHHALSFLVILAMLGLAALPGKGWGTIPGLALCLFPPLHLTASLRRLHGQGWIKSVLKAGMISFAYGFTVMITLLGLLILSLPKA